MSKKIKLAESTFVMVPAGDDVILNIDSAKALPAADPKVIEIVFKHANGGFIKQKYDLVKKLKPTDKTPIGLSLFTRLVRTAMGDENMAEFELPDDLTKLIDTKLVCEVKHTDPAASDKGYVYANIKRIIKKADDEATDTDEVEDEDSDL